MTTLIGVFFRDNTNAPKLRPSACRLKTNKGVGQPAAVGPVCRAAVLLTD